MVPVSSTSEGGSVAEAAVVIHFRDIESDDPVREHIEKRCRRLAEEFREISRIEITLAPSGPGRAAQAHVTGKNTDVATHAEADEAGAAADQALDKVGRQLRRVHEKRIFAQRREAQRESPKRRTQGG
jgi:ribosomal subunit interface protein